jgi:RNA-directed DNA polymerase
VSLYVKAKREPNFRFYILYDKVHRADILAHAYALCKARGGAPGVDGQRFADVAAYGEKRWLDELCEEVRAERYKPQAVRRVMIPKAGGGERPLGIPTIRDRVVQQAAKLVLEPIFEADFDDAAYGYRPKRGANDAVAAVHKALIEGHTQVIDADLSKFFDTIPHTELMRCLARRLCDGRMLHLVKMWLKAPVMERGPRGGPRMTGGKKSRQGVPQGGVISPLLANIYMHRFIKAFRKFSLDEKHGAVLVNYADDFVVLCRRDAKAALATIQRVMELIGLKLNEEKTSLRDGRTEMFNFLGYSFGPMRSPRNGHPYIGATVSKKSVSRLKEKIRGHLRPGNQAPWPEVVEKLNLTLRGFANYFRFGSVEKARRSIQAYTWDSVRRFLRRRHKISSGGYYVFSEAKVFGELGVFSLKGLPVVGYAKAWS